MTHANIVIGDNHTGSRYGLWPEGTPFGEGDTHGLNPLQQYIWECWQHAWDIWLPTKIGATPRVIWHLGDSIEGSHHGGSSLVSPEVSDHIRGALALLRPRVQGADAVIMVSGTEAHAGKAAEGDNGVAEAIGARPDETTGRFARWEAWEMVDGVLVHAAHHIRGSYVPSSDMTPLVGEYLEMSDACTAYDWPMPKVMLRGHSHKPRMYPHGGCVVVACPGWQAKTPFAFKQRRGRPAAIGMTLFVTHDGTYDKPEIKEYGWPKPTVRGIGWTADTPQPEPSPSHDSAPSSSPIGSPSLTQRLRRILTGR